MPCVAIAYSEKTRFHDRSDLRDLRQLPAGATAATPGPQRWFDHVTALRGAMEAGVQSQFPCDIFPDCKFTAEQLRPYRVLVLPEVTCLSDAEAAVITKWVQAGGLLIATGLSSAMNAEGAKQKNFSLADLFGCDFVSIEDRYIPNRWGSYLNRNGDPFWKELPDTTLVVEAPFIEVKPRTGTEVLATHILPAILWHEDKDNDDQAWVNWDPPPPGQVAQQPAVLRNKVGKGQAIYVTFDLFGMTDRKFLWPTDFFNGVLRTAVSDPPLRIDLKHGQAALGTTFYKKQNEPLLVVHQINRAVDQLAGRAPDADGGTLVIDNAQFRVRRCRQIFPEARDLTVKRTDRSSTIAMPPVAVHSVLLLEV